jgi:hypothetical protein
MYTRPLGMVLLTLQAPLQERSKAAASLILTTADNIALPQFFSK